jgi:hypothetical protein
MAVLAAGLLFGIGAWADGDTPTSANDRREIQRIISDQIAAFEAGDADRAFAHAAPGIASKFGDAERFMRMVREHYAPVYRPRAVEFLELREDQGQPTQMVLVVDQQGDAHIALYPMQRQDDGSWRIAGCFLRPAPDDSSA